jgi:hypothetical protein
MRHKRRFLPAIAELVVKEGWALPPLDTYFGWLRSKFYDGNPCNPIRKFGPPVASRTEADAEQEATET